jgi:O-antigen/teichoic acid export membrane protein
MLLRQSAIYLIANFVTVVVGLLSVVIFTRLLTPAEYGVFVIGLGTAGVFNAVLFTWLRLSLVRFQAESEHKDLRRTVMAGYLLSAVTLPIAFLVLREVTSTGMAIAGALIFYVLSVSLYEVGQEMLRARMLATHYAIGSIVRTSLALVLGVAAVSMFESGLALIVAISASFLIGALILCRTIWGGTAAPVQKDVLRDMLMFGMPLTVLGLTTALHVGLDRFILAFIYGKEMAGNFGAVNDFARQCIAIPCAGVFSAVLPLAVRGAANESPKAVQEQLAYSAELIAAITLPSAIGLALVSAHISQIIFGAQFRDMAVLVLPILAFSWAGHLFWQHYVHISFHLAKKPKLIIIQTSASLTFGAVAVLTGAALGGPRGTAFALVATEVFAAGIGLYLTRWGYKLPMPWSRFQRVALAALAMAVAILAIDTTIAGESAFEMALMVAVGGITYALAAVYFDVIDLRDKLKGRALPLDKVGALWDRATRRLRKA